MILLIGLGVMRIVEAWPMLRDVPLAVSVAYLIWLTWRIATAAPPGEARAGG